MNYTFWYTRNLFIIGTVIIDIHNIGRQIILHTNCGNEVYKPYNFDKESFNVGREVMSESKDGIKDAW